MIKKKYDHAGDDELHPPLKISFGVLTDKNVKQLKKLNNAIFPTKYNDQFYQDAINAPAGFVKLAYFNEVLVGAVCCRKEIFVSNHAEFHHHQQQHDTSSPTTKQPNGDGTSSTSTGGTSANANSDNNNKFSLYILTLGVLAPYRERGIGKQLIEHVLELTKSSPTCKDVVDIYVHVQEGNEEALRFYDRYGFQATEKLINYYKRIEPPDCFVIRKSVARVES